MTVLHLPAQSFEEAIPYLRAPYMPGQVRAKIMTTPENPAAPCMIALYAIGETQMDRFTLVCGSQWDHEFTKLAEESTGSGRQTSWYCIVAATFTAFGITRTDIGEGTSRSRAGAEMNARAQASKRAGRKFGPGHCLYACEPLVMFRGDQPNELRLPEGDDPKRHLKPYFDKEGRGQAYCREHYKRWLVSSGEKVYGPPLDHFAIAEAIRSRTPSQRPSSTNGSHIRQPVSTEGGQSRSDIGASHERAEDAGETRAPAEAQPATEKAYRPMPDRPAPGAALEAAQAAGYGERVARLLSNLAREEGKDSKFTAPQLQAVANWIATLSDLEVDEDVIVQAIEFNAAKNTSQERRQARFARWLSAKAAGESEPAAVDDLKEGANAAGGPTPNGNGQLLDAARALMMLRQAKDEHEYSDRTVTRLAALATGVGQKARVDWSKVSVATLLILAELLQSAGSLGWKNDHLDKEILKYHNSSEQTSSAGRFAAFANYLTDLAETRTMTTQAANAIEVA
jgi:hypothetical protein